MKPTIETSDLLVLGCFCALRDSVSRCVVTGTLRDAAGTLTPDVLTVCGAGWQPLAAALDTAIAIAPAHVLILSNAVDVVRALSPPFHAPPGEAVTVHVPPLMAGRKVSAEAYTVTVRQPDPWHWQVLMALTHWGGHFRAQVVADLPKAREIWQSQQWQD